MYGQIVTCSAAGTPRVRDQSPTRPAATANAPPGYEKRWVV